MNPARQKGQTKQLTDETATQAVSDPASETAAPTSDSSDDADGGSLEETAADSQPTDEGTALPGTETEDEGTEDDFYVAKSGFDRVIGLRDQEAQETFREIQTLPGFDDWLKSEKRRWDNDRGNLIKRMEDVPAKAADLLGRFYEAAANGDEAAKDVVEGSLETAKDLFSQALIYEIRNSPGVRDADRSTQFYQEFAPFLEGRADEDFLSYIRAYGDFRESTGEARGRTAGASEAEELTLHKIRKLEKANRLQAKVAKTPPAPAKTSKPVSKAPDLTTPAGIMASGLPEPEQRKLMDEIKNRSLSR